MSSRASTNTAATRITTNPTLSARAQALLPAGTNLQTAAAGFRNTGQFLAAVHVANNLNIPFAQLRARMTGSSPESLGRAIHDLNPNLTHKQIKSAIHTADRQAERDFAAARLTQDITANARLARQVQTLLPAGMTLQTAITGFRNEGQFLAAPLQQLVDLVHREPIALEDVLAQRLRIRSGEGEQFLQLSWGQQGVLTQVQKKALLRCLQGGVVDAMLLDDLLY